MAATNTLRQVLAAIGEVTDAIVATGANTQAAAVQLTGVVNIVSGADGTAAVKLPSAKIGSVCVIVNTAGSQLNLYPATGDSINAAAVNATVAIPATTACIAIASSATVWYLVPKTPS